MWPKTSKTDSSLQLFYLLYIIDSSAEIIFYILLSFIRMFLVFIKFLEDTRLEENQIIVKYGNYNYFN